MKLLLLVLAGCEAGGPPPATSPSATSLPSTWTWSGGQSGSDPVYAPCGTIGIGGAGDVVDGADGPFTATDVRELASGGFDGELRWPDGPTGVHAELRWDGEIRVLGRGGSGSSGCEPGLAIDGAVTLASDDGRLDEADDAVLVALSGARARFDLAWAEGAMGGSYVFPAGAETLQLWASVDAEGLHATLTTAAGGGSEPAGSIRP